MSFTSILNRIKAQDSSGYGVRAGGNPAPTRSNAQSSPCEVPSWTNSIELLKWRTMVAVWTLMLFLSACAKDKAPGVTCQDCTVNVSFNTEVIPILSANCATTGCHTGAATSAQNISFDSAVAYTQATARGRYIVAGNANQSIFYSQLLPGAINHMPNNGIQLTACDIQKIYCWINQGALNN